jgi:hypothetical protein
MKIRFYHWWLYAVFAYVWNPIFASRPEMARGFIKMFTEWMDEQEKK